MIKSAFIFIAFLLIRTPGFTQDSLAPLTVISKLKTGVYLNYQEFSTNNPSITTSFILTPNYIIKETKDSAGKRKDTVQYGFTCNWTASQTRIKKVFGTYDGKQLYIAFNEGNLMRPTQVLIPADYVGRFAIVTYKPAEKSYIPLVYGFGLAGVAAGLMVGAANMSKPIKAGDEEVIIYINKRGEPIVPTTQAIGFLLRKDHDLEKAFNEEKAFNNDVYKKYLLKMNQRYPL